MTRCIYCQIEVGDNLLCKDCQGKVLQMNSNLLRLTANITLNLIALNKHVSEECARAERPVEEAIFAGEKHKVTVKSQELPL